MNETGLKRGQPITFRLPSDTSDQTLKQLQKLKEVERRNFSSKIAEFVIDGVNDSLLKHREAITIPLPKGLTKAQRDWLKHEHSEALLGSIVYQLMSDPNRTAALFASLNSNAINVDDALYLQEETSADVELEIEDHSISTDLDDDLDNFDWDQLKEPESTSVEDEDDPLGDFLAQMNK
ncbi:hypothetical protein I2483_04520 [Sporosarcina sp. E16_3]|uniref:hypothetical protein n=1 Tax=Sporosarcina sp. E16_3 TaxID=2789293 RepID=UPI001A91F8B6|nr:hypothetical protein [Sporosarcina sp. E16_3]MBO0600913.1 hypothetical protein [Sporosarcina sp. E16_3]